LVVQTFSSQGRTDDLGYSRNSFHLFSITQRTPWPPDFGFANLRIFSTCAQSPGLLSSFIDKGQRKDLGVFTLPVAIYKWVPGGLHVMEPVYREAVAMGVSHRSQGFEQPLGDI
jgi:hypothetical protein